MKTLKTLSVLILLFSIGLSQDDWKQFKNEKRTYYSSLEGSDVENFSFLISSSEYIRLMQDEADSTYFYPLKIIWTKKGKVYYVMQPVSPNMTDSTRQQLITKVEELKQIFKGALSDWQQFSLFTPFHDIPENVSVSFGKDTVGISFEITEGNKVIGIRKMFSRGGQLVRVIWHGTGLRIATYPYYKEIENKWVCQGWQSQFYENGEVISGMAVVLKLKKLENFWLPTRINIIAQSKARPDQRSVVQLFLKNYVFNEEFEIVSQPSKTPEIK